MKDLTGKRFGKLVVLEFAGRNKHGDSTWLCACDCGGRRTASMNNLQRGHSWRCFDCGGFSRQQLPPGQAAFNKLYSGYMRSASKRGLVFSLQKEEFRELTKQPCYYCGAEPAQVATPSNGSDTGNYTYNGVDRKDNAIGYLPGNCVPCCKMCNLAKRDVPVKDFVQWILRAAEHVGLQPSDYD